MAHQGVIVSEISELLEKIKNMSVANKALVTAMFSVIVAGVALREEGSTEVESASEEYEEPVSNQGDYDTVGSSVGSGGIEQSCESQSLPSFVNVSLSWGESNIFTEALGSMSPPSIIVTSAGNSHPEDLSRAKTRLSKEFGGIIVGNLNTDGTRTPSSVQGEEVHIMAPSSFYIATKDAEGGRRFIGGTSGAAALVTGSLGAFEWLSGYHPTAQETKLLLEKTAILTQYSNEDPQKNGVGMVNSYMLAMVGKRLKELCGNDVACFQSKINEESTYKFSEDEGLASAVVSAFPECGRGNVCSGSASSCFDKKAVFKRLRKAAFLNPSDQNLWRDVACVYSTGGFDENVKGVLSIYKSLFGPSVDGVLAHQTCSSNEDCVLVPSCSNQKSSDWVAPFSAVTVSMAGIYNMDECQEKRSLCNGKCSCSSTEVGDNEDGQSGQYSVACVNSQCLLNNVLVQSDRVPTAKDSVRGDSISIDDEAVLEGVR